jgi:hypothetical protein
MRFLLLVLSFFLCAQTVNALEEIILDTKDIAPSLEIQEISEKENEVPTLIKKLREEDESCNKKTTYLLEETLTKHFDNSIIDTMHLFGYYRAGLQMDIDNDDEDLTYSYSSLNTGINGKFKDGKTYYEARFRFNPQHKHTFFQYLPSNMYIANSAIPHHTVVIGNMRTPTGYEGGLSLTTIPFFAKSQIARNLSNSRKVGLRIKGNYNYIDYDLGGYSSDTYFRKFFPGAEFTGWANLKPFGEQNKEKYGLLKLGGGVTAGRNDTNYFVSGAYAGYEYKKFNADFEWSKANGYNGNKGVSTNHAEGFYTTLGYKITPKVQAVARYDQFTPNINNSKDIRREYSAGINYFIKGQSLKVMLNYVFCQNDLLKDSHRIVLGTQILL